MEDFELYEDYDPYDPYDAMIERELLEQETEPERQVYDGKTSEQQAD